MGLHDTAGCCVSWSDSICSHHLVQIPDFVIAKSSPATPSQSFLHTLWKVWYRGLQLFHQHLATHRPSYLTQRFWTMIQQSKVLYSTALLSSLCVPWLAGAFWHCFASSTVISWQQFFHIGQLHTLFSLQWMLTLFSWHWFNYAVMFGAVSFLSHKLMTLMKFSSALIVVAFGLPALLFGLVLFHFLMCLLIL